MMLKNSFKNGIPRRIVIVVPKTGIVTDIVFWRRIDWLYFWGKVRVYKSYLHHLTSGPTATGFTFLQEHGSSQNE